MKKYHVIAAVCVVLVVSLLLIISGCGSDYKWGKGITEGIPLPQDMSAASTSGNENSAAAYFENVSSEAASAYISLIESECGVKFQKDGFPKTAVFGERIIVVHYNVTKTELSVTVAAKGNNDNNISGDKK